MFPIDGLNGCPDELSPTLKGFRHVFRAIGGVKTHQAVVEQVR